MKLFLKIIFSKGILLMAYIRLYIYIHKDIFVVQNLIKAIKIPRVLFMMGIKTKKQKKKNVTSLLTSFVRAQQS